MMSPQMIQQVLLKTDLPENTISQTLFVPCLQKLSMAMGYPFRDVKFVGGTTEQGNDIEFYEVIGPDRYRFYTGIQIKKNNIGQTEATDLIRQGTQALEKNITDPSTGTAYRFGRWIVAATGSISTPARNMIQQELSRYGKLISFWDGIRLSELLLDHFYEEFVRALNVDVTLAQSGNVRINLWDQVSPPTLLEAFDAVEWTDVDITRGAPPTASAIFLVFFPIDRNMPGTKIAVKTSLDDLVIDSLMSQAQLIPVRLNPGETKCKLKLLEQRPVKVACRGFQFCI